jgi:hypothetical protein
VKPHAAAVPNIGRATELSLNGSRFFGMVRPSRKTDPEAPNDGLSRSCQRWRSPLSLAGGIRPGIVAFEYEVQD